MPSAAFPRLEPLRAGDPVPAELYVKDYTDGTRPRWTVHEVRELRAGVRTLVLIDPDQRRDDGDLFTPGTPVAVTVLTCRQWTRRSQEHWLGEPMGGELCDLDQQARYVAKSATGAAA